MPTRVYEMSVRPAGVPQGGNVVPVHFPDGETMAGRGSALLLIHGYNNSREDARRSFATFVASLERAAQRTSIPWMVFGVQWPSDERNKAHSTVAYASKIPKARESAECIFRTLGSAFGPGGAPIALSIVAHSLGCRVALELLQMLAVAQQRPRVVIEQVILMAAAVPTKWTEPGEKLQSGTRLPRGVRVLHSTGDDVLRLAFPAGQTHGKDGFFPTAVGRHGGPNGTWLAALAMAAGGKEYNHGDYWAGVESTSAAARFLGIAGANQLSARGTVHRGLVEPNAISARGIPVRRIGVG